VQTHSQRTSTELTEFHWSGSSNVDQKSSQKRHDAAEHSFGKSRFRTRMPWRVTGSGWLQSSRRDRPDLSISPDNHVLNICHDD